ncbi:MAG: TIGR01777 family oxidoreductase [Kofleriaceae bacterium]|nr:TIGR01777 family oxidoreductase [Kofleriaceae bacterium]MBP9166252.1 TIGR01777 family oxidoreductase [Kofleriaceae bacterium]MBP9859059.1 TIGR01777 family oxidoreductase [Kofleriaceae bacterium]
MNLVVTGATGFLGRALGLRLARDGHAITALARDPAGARAVLGAEVAVAALGEPAAVAAAIASADAVINLAGEPILDRRWTARRRAALRASRIDLTARLVAAIAARGRRLPVLVSASAVGWYGDRGDQVLDEASGPGDGFAAELCRDWELAAEAARSHCDRVVRARIGIVLGGEGGALTAMRRPFAWGVGGPVGSGRQWVPWIHLDDAVEALVRAVTDPRLDGAVNLVAPVPTQNRALGEAIGAALGRPSWLPAPSLGVRLALGERAGLVLGGQRVLPAALTAVGFRWAYPELGPAVAEALRGDPDAVTLGPAPAELPSSAYLRARPPRYTLTARTVIDRPLDEVFEFFCAAANLGAITPPDMAFRIVTPQPIAMAEGTVIDYRIRATGVPMSWRTVIDVWEPPAGGRARFVDSQVRGPYACWWHEHRFEADGARTIMIDTVHYAPPLGPLGAVANRVMVARELRRIFAQRGRAIRLRFGAGLDGAGDRDQLAGDARHPAPDPGGHPGQRRDDGASGRRDRGGAGVELA